MKKVAIALTALSMLAAPALADTIHTDGPGQGFSRTSVQATVNTSAKNSFAATVRPVAASGKKTNFSGRGGVSIHTRVGGGR